jgi:hypothetical protein
VTEHEAELEVGLPSVQLLAENEPEPLAPKVIDPVGALLVPALLSVTVALQVVAVPLATLLGVQLRAVDVARAVTVTVPVLLLARCVVSLASGV